MQHRELSMSALDEQIQVLQEAYVNEQGNSLVMRVLLRCLVETHPDKPALFKTFQTHMQDLQKIMPGQGADMLQASIDNAYNSFAEAMKPR